MLKKRYYTILQGVLYLILIDNYKEWHIFGVYQVQERRLMGVVIIFPKAEIILE